MTPSSRVTPSAMGRDAELALLTRAAAALSSQSTGGAFYIEGVAGIGKSYLVEGWRLAIADFDLPFARGCCPGGGEAPFAPFAAALAPYLDFLSVHSEQLSPVLARLWPDISARSSQALEPAREALRLQGALREAVTEIACAEPRGLVLVLEDWHWADQASVELAKVLVQDARALPIMLVFTARPLAAGRAVGGEGLQILTLDPGSDRHGEMPAATNLADWVISRLLPAPALAREIAGLLAVRGVSTDEAFLTQASGRPQSEISDTLSVLVRAQLATAGPLGLGLAHERIGEALLRGASPEELIHWNGASATALVALAGEALPSSQPLSVVTAVAAHALAAGLGNEGSCSHLWSHSDAVIAYTLEAGKRCAALHANVVAEKYLGAGLAALRRSGAAKWRHEILYGLHALADVRRLTGKFSDALASYDEALRLADALENRERLAQIQTSLAKVHQGLDDLENAAAFAFLAIESAQVAGAPAEGARAALTAARLRFYQADTVAARELVGRALGLAREAEDTVRTAEALAFSGHLHFRAVDGDSRAGLDALHESISLLTELGDKAGLAQSYTLLGDAQVTLGDLVGAKTSFNLARWICQEVGNRTDEGIALLNLAIAALEGGDLAEAASHAQTVSTVALKMPNRFQWVVAEVLAIAAATQAGQVGGARERLMAAIDEAQRLENRYLEQLVLPWAAETLLFLGHAADARNVALRLQAGLDGAGQNGQARLAALMADILLDVGESASAADHATRAARALGAGLALPDRARVERTMAKLAAARGDVTEALRAAKSWSVTAKRAGMRLAAVEAQVLVASLAKQDPNGQHTGFEELRAAASTAHELGAPILEASARWALANALPGDEGLEDARLAQSLAERLLCELDASAHGAFVARQDRHWMVRAASLIATVPAGNLDQAAWVSGQSSGQPSPSEGNE